MNIVDTVKGLFPKKEVLPVDEMSVKDLLAKMPSLFKTYQTDKRLYKQQSALNLAYLAGFVQQDITNSATTDSNYVNIYNDVDKRGLTNFTVNYLIDPFRNLLSTMLNNIPAYDVFSAQANDDYRIRIGQTATEILKYHDEKIFNGKSKWSKLFTWALACGTAYLDMYTEEVESYYEDQSQLDEAGNPVRKKQVRLQVDIRTIWDVASSQDSLSGMIDDDTYQIIKSSKSLGYIKSKWPDKYQAIAKKSPETVKVLGDELRRDLAEAKGSGHRDISSLLTGDDRVVDLYYVYHKKTNEYPNGWWGVADKDGMTVYSEPKLPFDVMPLTQLDTNNLDPNEHIKNSIFNDARGPQVLLQGIANSSAKNALLGACPPEIRVKGVTTNVDNKRKSTIYPKHGEVVEVEFKDQFFTAVRDNPAIAAALMPHFMDVPGLNQNVQWLQEKFERVIINVTGQSTSNVGSLPNTNISGESVKEQMALDQIGQLPLLALSNDFWYRFRAKTLKAVRLVYPGRQLQHMLVEPSKKIISEFKMEDLDDSFDVRMITSEGLPTTARGRVELFMNLLGTAAKLAPDSVGTIWKQILDIFGRTGTMERTEDIEESLAKQENLLMTEDPELISLMNKMVPARDALGQPIIDPNTGQPAMEPFAKQKVQNWVNKYQDSLRHIVVHRPPIVGPEAMKLGPEICQLIAWHIEKHQQMEEIRNADEIQNQQIEQQIKQQELVNLSQGEQNATGNPSGLRETGMQNGLQSGQ